MEKLTIQQKEASRQKVSLTPGITWFCGPGSLLESAIFVSWRKGLHKVNMMFILLLDLMFMQSFDTCKICQSTVLTPTSSTKTMTARLEGLQGDWCMTMIIGQKIFQSADLSLWSWDVTTKSTTTSFKNLSHVYLKKKTFISHLLNNI